MENIDFDRLRDLFYGDNTYNVDSLNDLYETARDTRQGNQRKFTKKEVKYYLNKQESYQLDLQFNKPKKFDAITSEVNGRGLQADLIFFKRSFGEGKFTSRASGEKYVRGGKNTKSGATSLRTSTSWTSSRGRRGPKNWRPRARSM
jgi:hypothetical protein